MKNRVLKKLYSQSGESIGETLIALLISALALVMLAGAVSAGMRIVTNSKAKMDEYYTVNNAIVARATTAPTVKGTAAPGFSRNTLTVNVSNLLPTGTIPPATYWKNETLSAVPIIIYSIPTQTPAPTIAPGI